MLLSLTRLNKGPKTHAVLEPSKTLCGQPLSHPPNGCGLAALVTCVGCQKTLVNLGLLEASTYLFHKRMEEK